MYDELVKRLRNNRHPNGLKSQAADAIDELSASVEGLKSTTNMVFEETEGRTVLKFEPKWIPVTERLPERRKNVLCCGVRGGMFVGWFTNISPIFDGRTTAFVHGGKGRYVTHWMPLPQPPKDGEA